MPERGRHVLRYVGYDRIIDGHRRFTGRAEPLVVHFWMTRYDIGDNTVWVDRARKNPFVAPAAPTTRPVSFQSRAQRVPGVGLTRGRFAMGADRFIDAPASLSPANTRIRGLVDTNVSSITNLREQDTRASREHVTVCVQARATPRPRPIPMAGNANLSEFSST